MELTGVGAGQGFVSSNLLRHIVLESKESLKQHRSCVFPLTSFEQHCASCCGQRRWSSFLVPVRYSRRKQLPESISFGPNAQITHRFRPFPPAATTKQTRNAISWACPPNLG